MLGISSPKLPSRQVQMHKSFRFGNIFLNSHKYRLQKKDFGLFHFYEFSNFFFSCACGKSVWKIHSSGSKAQKLSRSKSIVGSGLLPFCQKASFEKFINHAYASYAIYMMRWLSSLISFLTNDDEKTFKVEETLKLLEIHRRIYSLYLSWENTKKGWRTLAYFTFSFCFSKVIEPFSSPSWTWWNFENPDNTAYLQM